MSKLTVNGGQEIDYNEPMWFETAREFNEEIGTMKDEEFDNIQTAVTALKALPFDGAKAKFLDMWAISKADGLPYPVDGPDIMYVENKPKRYSVKVIFNAFVEAENEEEAIKKGVDINLKLYQIVDVKADLI